MSNALAAAQGAEQSHLLSGCQICRKSPTCPIRNIGHQVKVLRAVVHIDRAFWLLNGRVRMGQDSHSRMCSRDIYLLCTAVSGAAAGARECAAPSFHWQCPLIGTFFEKNLQHSFSNIGNFGMEISMPVGSAEF